MVPTMKRLSIVLLTVSFGLLLLISFGRQANAQTPPAHDGNGLINCYCDGDCRFSSIGEPVKDHNGVSNGHIMTWYLVGPTDTIVTITFADKDECKGSPFDKPVPSGKIKNTGQIFSKIISPPVKSDAKGCFYYEIACTASSGLQTQTQQSTSSDPIIDVPPKP
jgi:hypothetical protein